MPGSAVGIGGFGGIGGFVGYGNNRIGFVSPDAAA